MHLDVVDLLGKLMLKEKNLNDKYLNSQSWRVMMWADNSNPTNPIDFSWKSL